MDDLIDELDDMGRSKRKELKSRLMVLVKHLLKCRVQPDHLSSGWLGTLNEQRNAIDSLLEDAPSLKEWIPEYLQATYHRALREAAAETTLPVAAFPDQLPFSQQQILDRDFLPGSPAILRRIKRRARDPAQR